MADEEKRLVPEAIELTESDHEDDGYNGDHGEDGGVMEGTDEDACCICQDVVDILKQGHLSSCDHRFHFDCIIAWAKVTNLCPLCKTKFNSVTRQDAQGAVVHREVIKDVKQVYRPDPSDHDIAAQLRLMWEDQSRSRQELAATAIATRDSSLLNESGNNRPSQRSNRVSSTFAPEYCELAKLMQDAVNSDNYASSVSLLIPKTAKLRLVSRVKTFFGRLNQKEKAAGVELGCLSVLHDWIRVPEQEGDTSTSPNAQVLDAVIAILETLPVRKEDLVDEEGLQATLDSLSELSDVGIEIRQRIIELSEKWRDLNPPTPIESPRPQATQQVSSPVNAAPSLPVIEAFTSPKRPARANGKQKRKREAWSDTVVEYVKAKLYPLYKQNDGSGKLTKERFKAIVKEVADLFSQEAASMQSAVLLPSGELSNLAKSRIKKLIDRVYKASTSAAASSRTRFPTPLLMRASTYSAVPSVKRQRR
ncbi:hypothetical protein AM588_10011736 [Phytophthora nicotianae]|uniref:RING-type domain-containing protein n=1 Tax=Phytophthora nicotianae TaxID=4792 RepID=A0A0W8DM62_PHYNI|nr:hypothetical protein AM588_10011736 [Phytophthora nicotianae]